ncbi:M1 family metallopeptidase [Streptomyces sp. OZ13]|uniref:M1 family metallopeptidase n=1 Tax=Streptomyces sp. OZ13 TaxID=3452210 RepID=UPI003F8CB6D8
MDPHLSRRPALLRTALALLLVAAAAMGCSGDGAGVRGTPGAAGLRDPYFPRLGNGGYDVRHYGLTLGYDPRDGRLRGTAELTALATQDLSAFHLDLRGMTVERVTVDGAEAAVNRAGTELTVRPRRDIDKGAEFRTVVRYTGVPQTVTDADGSKEGWLRAADGDALAVGQPVGSMAWFPGNHHPADKAAYDITVTVPDGYEAVSNGEPAGERTKGGRTVFTWRSEEPMASFLVLLAVGDFRTATTRTAAGLPVVTAVDPAATEQSAALLRRLPRIVEWGTEKFGPYPFSSAGAVVVPAGEVGYALETQSRPVFPLDRFDEETLVHELAHQWFGNSVTPASWRDIWLSESFATYAEWMWLAEAGDTPVRESFEDAFADQENWAFAPAVPPRAEDIFAAPVYGRGAMVLHKLREAVGDDVFFKIARGWARKYRHANASTGDFTAYAEARSGKDLTELWKVWLYGDDKPRSP